MHKKFWALACAGSFALGLCGCEPRVRMVELVQDGAPLAEIVVAEEPLSSVRLAASDLRETIGKISGAELPVVHTPSGGGVLPIFVGDSPALAATGVTSADLPPEGYVIDVRPDAIVLLGRDEQRTPFPFSWDAAGEDRVERWMEFAGQPSHPPEFNYGHLNRDAGFRTLDATGTYYAVAAFLEQLGVRWYAPGADGTVIPQSDTLQVAAGRVERSPRFPYREVWYGRAVATDNDGFLWLKRLKYGSSFLISNEGHSLRNILRSDKMLEAHPEFYGRRGDNIIMGHDGASPKLSDPGFRAASHHYAAKAFEAEPDLLAMALGMPDGWGLIDDADAAKWVDPDAPADAVHSNYAWDYWLDMAGRLQESHPGRLLNCYSYTSYQQPPDGVEKLPDNVALTMVYGVSLSMLPIYTNHLTPLRQRWLDLLTSGHFFIWEYVLFYRKNNPTVPVVFTKILQQELRDLEGVLAGKFTETMPWRVSEHELRLANPALTHMIHYLQGKLYWEPDLDLEALLDEFYTLYYGPAREPMQEFWELAEEVWTRPESRSITPTTGFLTEADVNRYFELLAAARAKVEPGEIYDRRIAALENEMAPLRHFFDRLQRTGPKLQGRVAAPPESLDGNLAKPFWQDGPWFDMRELVSGHPLAERLRTRVAFRLSPDRSKLYVGVECGEPEMDRLVTTARKHDDPAIFNDDTIEIYLESPERSFFKIVVNAAGIVWDESQDGTIVDRDTMPVLWNPGIEAAIAKGRRGWSAEIAIPTADLGDARMGPSSSHPWGVNVCRARWVTGEIEAFAISPTGQLWFGDLTKLGFLAIEN